MLLLALVSHGKYVRVKSNFGSKIPFLTVLFVFLQFQNLSMSGPPGTQPVVSSTLLYNKHLMKVYSYLHHNDLSVYSGSKYQINFCACMLLLVFTRVACFFSGVVSVECIFVCFVFYNWKIGVEWSIARTL